METLLRKICCLACLAGLVLLASDVVGQPPRATDPAKEDLADGRAKLQKQLADLLKRVEAAPPASVGAAAQPKVTPGKSDSLDKSVDPLRVGMNLFRENDFDGALRAFRFVDTGTLTREDRAFAQYMHACCLRRLNKVGEAIEIYREVAASKEDEFVADMAIWQLTLLRSSQELESQIEQLRTKPKTR